MEPGEQTDSVYSDLRINYESETGSPFTDSLTSLYNHGFFLEVLSRELKRSRRHGAPLSLLMIDVDGFGRYNHHHGSMQGDRALKEVARAIKETIRDTDLASRYLGDRFAVLLYGAGSPDATLAAQRIKAVLDERMRGALTVCMACVSSGDTGDRDSVLLRAEEALTAAKIRGKGTIYTADTEKAAVNNEQSRVLVVDDEPINAKVLEAMLLSLGCEVIKAEHGEEALRKLGRADIDLILLDVMMPVMDGFETCRRIKGSEQTRMIPVVMVTALDDAASKIRAIEEGADDFLTKPVNRIELIARIRSLIRTKKLNDSLVGLENVLFSLANAVEAKDAYTDGHIKRVSNLAVDLGRMMDLPPKEIKALRIGGMLHDIGKIGIPDSILNKPGSLDPEEWETLKTHPDLGCKVAEPLGPILKGALEVIRHHHEKLDGSGYPDGIKGEEISMAARIMAVADIYDALVSDRPYRKGVPKEKALSLIEQDSHEGRLDPKVVACLVRLVSDPARRQGDSDTRTFVADVARSLI